ncbi:uncharacterized protein LOC136767505 [Amia ocellicauda]|uniref:uncharacterized protein LOC136767505 n=1 Tax=Amia ocellicauda TaxID=2972642 RepID=UPI0034643E10
MDFDYQSIKEEEAQHREEILRSLPIPHERRLPRPQYSESPPPRKAPPIRPRGSLRVRPLQEGVAPPRSQPANSRSEREAGAPVMAPLCLEPLPPSLRAHTLLWFERTQLPRLRQPDGSLPDWLHGFATRREAEELLKDEMLGCFLLRLSESKIGFVLSYRGQDRCRHFIVEELKGGKYVIAGEDSHHGSLQELLSHYSTHPVGPFAEILSTPCSRAGGGCREFWWGGTGKLCVAPPTERQTGGGRLERRQAPADSTTAQTAQPLNSDTAQYAVVKKPLRKSKSLIHTHGDIAPPGEEFVPREPGAKAPPTDEHADAPYARVNKPPRATAAAATAASTTTTTTTTTSSSPPTAASFPLSRRGSGGEQKYWELVPMHTYEETGHLATPPHQGPVEEDIAFYAMGRSGGMAGGGMAGGGGVGVGETAGNSAASPQNHLYSEVNLRRGREGAAQAFPPPPSAPVCIPNTGRHAPELPQRPPPRSVGSPLRQDCLTQPETPFNLRAGLPPLPRSDRGAAHSGTSIYEHIRERGTPPLPPLPPPNNRHRAQL